MRRKRQITAYDPQEQTPKSKRAGVETTSANEVQRRLKLVTEDYKGIRITKEGVILSELLPTWRATLSDLPRTGSIL